MAEPSPACPACGSTRIEPGLLGSSALWLESQSALSRAFSGAELKALVCMDCGHVQLRADPERLRQLLK